MPFMMSVFYCHYSAIVVVVVAVVADRCWPFLAVFIIIIIKSFYNICTAQECCRIWFYYIVYSIKLVFIFSFFRFCFRFGVRCVWCLMIDCVASHRNYAPPMPIKSVSLYFVYYYLWDIFCSPNDFALHMTLNIMVFALLWSNGCRPLEVLHFSGSMVRNLSILMPHFVFIPNLFTTVSAALLFGGFSINYIFVRLCI